MDEIKENEYIRTKTGIIDKIIHYDNDTKLLRCKNNNFIDPFDNIAIPISTIVKHSFNIKELIENTDILKVKTKENAILMIGFDENIIDIKYKEIIEEIENGEYELLEILTHEQYERNCYRLEEE